jgi:membrane protease YdiL (CAAX protease family)
MTNSTKRITAITIFCIIAIGLRYYITQIKPDFFTNSNLYINILLQGIGPLLGGLFVIKFLKRPNELKFFGIGLLKTLLAISIPIVLFSLVGILNTGKPYLNAPKYIAIILVYALFEEYGWRNYLQSELSDLNKIIKYLIITILWFIWHLNFELTFNNLIFFLILFAGSFGIGYVADQTKSLIFVALFHAFFNISQNELLSGIELKQKLIIVAISIVSAMAIMKYDKIKKRESTTANTL